MAIKKESEPKTQMRKRKQAVASPSSEPPVGLKTPMALEIVSAPSLAVDQFFVGDHPGVPAELLLDIRLAFQQGRYLLGDHAYERMDERSVAPPEIRRVVLEGFAIEYDPPGGHRPSGVLFNGRTSGGRPLHVKVGFKVQRQIRHYVITVYEPFPHIFKENFSVRISAVKEQEL